MCFTDELPGETITGPGDVWGFMDSQETVSISPKMFADFIFPAYQKVASTYGLLSYGCCEPVDPVWDCIGSLDNLRKVSISPWCNEDIMAERLRGSRTIYHRKPSPNFLGVNPDLGRRRVPRPYPQNAANRPGLPCGNHPAGRVHHSPQ